MPGRSRRSSRTRTPTGPRSGLYRAGRAFLAGLRGAVADRPPLRERLAILAREVDAVPPRRLAEPRGDNEILGYDEGGVC